MPKSESCICFSIVLIDSAFEVDVKTARHLDSEYKFITFSNEETCKGEDSVKKILMKTNVCRNLFTKAAIN